MSEQGYDKVFSAMHGVTMKDQPVIDLPSYEDLAMAAVDVAHMHLRRDQLRGGFYCDVCLQRGKSEGSITHLKSCTAGRLLAWLRVGGWTEQEDGEARRLRENAKELLHEVLVVLRVFDDGEYDANSPGAALENLDNVVAKIMNED